ncbi:MAG: hypothetical protein HQ579_08920 [Candidatus Omnitrophica bacterium]|nr:hypothetical protein [Candidatus Omnitrophota bacterium]
MFVNPHDLLLQTEKDMNSVPAHILFNDSRHQKLLENWCAAVFGLGYNQFIKPCTIEPIESERDSVDFRANIDNKIYNFQITETMKGNRTRGCEFKDAKDRPFFFRDMQPELGNEKGYDWVFEIIKNKVKKHYPDAKNLNLLVYINFEATDLRRDMLIDKLRPFQDIFSSIWVITSYKICSIFSNSSLGDINGWGPIKEMQIRHIKSGASPHSDIFTRNYQE